MEVELAPSLVLADFNTVAPLTLNMNLATTSLEIYFNSKTAETITQVGALCNLITGTSPFYVIALQNSSGVDLAVTAPFQFTATFVWRDLTSSYTPTIGQSLILVVRYSSGTIDASNVARLVTGYGGGQNYGWPYPCNNLNGTRTRSAIYPVFGYGNTNHAFGFPVTGDSSIVSWASPYVGCPVYIPRELGDTCIMRGIRMRIGIAASSGVNVYLRHYGASQAATHPIGGYIVTGLGQTQGSAVRLMELRFPATIRLISGAIYRIDLVGSGGNTTIPYLTFLSEKDRKAVSPFTWYWASSSGIGDMLQWLPLMSPIIEPVWNPVSRIAGRRASF